MNWNRDVCSVKLLIFNNGDLRVSRGSEMGVVHNYSVDIYGGYGPTLQRSGGFGDIKVLFHNCLNGSRKCCRLKTAFPELCV
jgi:hypothetical protein